MTLATIGKQYRLECSHQLPHHAGKCQRLHGHSYRVELELCGETQPVDGSSDEGMVLDFAQASAAWRSVHERLDHRHLNDVLPERFQPPTAEHLAAYLCDELTGALAQLVGVTVWETATSWARVQV